MIEQPNGIKFLTVAEVAARIGKSESWVWDKTNPKSKNYDPISAPRHEVYGGTRFVESEVDEWFVSLIKKVRGAPVGNRGDVVSGYPVPDVIETRSTHVSSIGKVNGEHTGIREKCAALIQIEDASQSHTDQSRKSEIASTVIAKSHVPNIQSVLAEDEVDSADCERSLATLDSLVATPDDERPQDQIVKSSSEKISGSIPNQPRIIIVQQIPKDDLVELAENADSEIAKNGMGAKQDGELAISSSPTTGPAAPGKGFVTELNGRRAVVTVNKRRTWVTRESKIVK